jgi:hypothetical protein
VGRDAKEGRPVTTYIERWEEITKAVILKVSKEEFGALTADEDAFWDAVAEEVQTESDEGVVWEVPT